MATPHRPDRPDRSGRLRVPHLPRPVERILSILGVPVSEVRRYWWAEAGSIRASAGALALGLVATLIAGLVLGGAREPLAANPGLLILIPAAIGMRGSIFGALAARLSTGILTGQFEPAYSRTGFLGRQIEAAALLSISTSAQAGLIAWGAAHLVGRPTIPLLEMVTISVVGGLLSSVVLLGTTVALARRSLARGWSLDDVGAPSITATGDLITLPALLLATLLLSVPVLPEVIGSVALVAGVAAAVHGVRSSEASLRHIVRESLIVLTISVTLDVFAGVVMDTRLDDFLTNPALLVMIPPFIANCGSLGGMLASRLASKLHVGLLEPRTWPTKLGWLDISVTFLMALVAFIGVGSVGWFAASLAGLNPPGIVTLLGVALLGGLFATVLLSAVAYIAATATFRFGLDPDNHGIPIVTASMDLLGILCLVGAIGLISLG